MKTKVLLIGGRNKAKSLATSLLTRGYQVTAINKSHDDCLMLATIDNLEIFEGDGSKPFILEDADASEYKIAIALTARDEDNLVICQLCKKRFHISKTVSLVSDPQKTDFFHQMGIDRVVCAISAVTNIIEQQAFMEQMTKIIPIGEGRVQIAEVSIPSASPAVNKTLSEIHLPVEVIIGCVLRGAQSMIPRGDTKILADDILVLISGNGQELAAIKELTGRKP